MLGRLNRRAVCSHRSAVRPVKTWPLADDDNSGNRTRVSVEGVVLGRLNRRAVCSHRSAVRPVKTWPLADDDNSGNRTRVSVEGGSAGKIEQTCSMFP